MKLTEISEAVKIALTSIKTNKVRSFLASLGVVIGISVVILMGWALMSLNDVLDNTFSMMGADIVNVDKWDWSGGLKWDEMQSRKDITYRQAKEACEEIKSAEVVVPQITDFGATVKYKDKKIEASIRVTGTHYEYGNMPQGEVTEGRFFNQNEQLRNADVVVIGSGVNELLFSDSYAVGKDIKLNGHIYNIIGIVKKQGTTMMDFVDNQVYLPIGAFHKAFGGRNSSYTIVVKAGSEDKLEQVKAEVEGVMRNIRNLKPGQANDFSLNDTKQFEQIFAKLRLYVWGVGLGMTCLSFLVGIIGIMNIMFVAVAERTKEIGIRKALGAPRRSIVVQFVVEATTLCFIGAITALVICEATVFAVAKILPKFYPSLDFLSPIMPFSLFFVATFVSIIVGILAGLIPAYRAANLNVVDSIRYD